ncbi:MAG: SsrA-binding protein SmpB [bacterium]
MSTLSESKKSYFDYKILEKMEAGLVLLGTEVKAIKTGRMNIKGTYIAFNENGEPQLIGCNIPPYQPRNAPLDYNPERPRKLLLKKDEIRYLIGKVKEKGLTLIPLRVYTKRGKIKLEFGIAQGKKKVDKREAIKEKEFKRNKERLLKEI